MNTTPVENILRTDRGWERYAKLYLEFSRSLPRPLVLTHKQVLGRQDHCFTGSEFRFWVWENPKQGWRVYVNNRKGICFEVMTTMNAEAALEAWKLYTDRFEAIRTAWENA